VLAYLAVVLADRPAAAIFVDLDRFKPVNDTLGHAAGDELLVKVAERLAGLLRDEDVVGRIGGDEFLLVLPGVGDPDEAKAIGERVHEALHRPFEISGEVVAIGASIGVACGPEGSTSDDLVAHADEAMYVSKREGAGRPVVG
jgi:diguanylate cyclase (GGDEF)-like protein